MEKMLFLLGGHDLEMLTIRSLLEQNRIPYKDHALSWHNARLSSYLQDMIEADAAHCTIWGVELMEDIPPVASYHRIDHHNDLSHLPSALEQVVSILSVPMNRYLQLVSANDQAYIPGMEQLGATSEEIASIRRADRAAQGVTPEEDRLAEEAVNQHTVLMGDLWVVQAKCTSFSPICDRMYPYARLLVHTDTEWVYYGKYANRVVTLFNEEYQNHKLYAGGGENGYVGTVQGVYNPYEIQSMVKQIINLQWKKY